MDRTRFKRRPNRRRRVVRVRIGRLRRKAALEERAARRNESERTIRIFRQNPILIAILTTKIRYKSAKNRFFSVFFKNVCVFF